MQKPFKDFQITINGSTLNNHSHLDYGKEVSLFDVRSMLIAVTELVNAIIADESQQLFPGNPDAEKLLENYNLNRDFNGEIDQIHDLIEGMKQDIMSSRLKVNAWNPSEINKTALPPCHSEFQVIGVPLANGNFGFELHWNQRSCDVFLGIPFNIASYGLLAKILESITGYKALAIEGNFKCVHFYDNQYEAVKELLSRNPDTHPNCELEILFENQGIGANQLFEHLEISDFKLAGYSCDKEIKVEMLAPKE